jgi:hypothetical protein
MQNEGLWPCSQEITAEIIILKPQNHEQSIQGSLRLYIYTYFGEVAGELRSKVLTQIPSWSNRDNNYKDII